jgi:hypothetical protein
MRVENSPFIEAAGSFGPHLPPAVTNTTWDKEPEFTKHLPFRSWLSTPCPQLLVINLLGRCHWNILKGTMRTLSQGHRVGRAELGIAGICVR